MLGLSAPRQSTQVADKEGRVTYESGPATPLSLVLAIGIGNSAPLGLVLGKEPLLCERSRPIKLQNATIQEALTVAVEGTGYTVSLQNGVYVITAPDVTEHEALLLGHRFPWFSGAFTMEGLGQLLGGYITEADGAKGFILDVISSPEEKALSTGVIKDATTEEIANRIVLLGNKGAWIFRPTPAPPSGIRNPIQIFEYVRDDELLRQTTCEVQ